MDILFKGSKTLKIVALKILHTSHKLEKKLKEKNVH